MILDSGTQYSDPMSVHFKVSIMTSIVVICHHTSCFPGGADVKESACSIGDLGLIPGSGRSPGERNGNPLQYSCLGIPMDRGAWWATVHGVAKNQTRLSDQNTHHTELLATLPTLYVSYLWLIL